MSDEDEAILELQILEEPTKVVENPTRPLTVHDEPEEIMRTSGRQRDNSRVLKLASIAHYRAKRQIATAEKRLATKLLVAGQRSRFPM